MSFMTPTEAASLKIGDLLFSFVLMMGGVYLGETPNEYELTSPSGSIVRVCDMRVKDGLALAVHIDVLTGPGAGVFNAFDWDDQEPVGYPFRKLTEAEAHVARLMATTVCDLSRRYNADLAGGGPHDIPSREPSGATFVDFDEEMTVWAGSFAK